MARLETIRQGVLTLIAWYPGIEWTHMTMHPNTFREVLFDLGLVRRPPSPWTLLGFNVDTNWRMLSYEIMFMSRDRTRKYIRLLADTHESKFKPRTWLPKVPHPLIDQNVAMDREV